MSDDEAFDQMLADMDHANQLADRDDAIRKLRAERDLAVRQRDRSYLAFAFMLLSWLISTGGLIYIAFVLKR